MITKPWVSRDKCEGLANQELVTLVTIGEHDVGCQYDTSSGGTCHMSVHATLSTRDNGPISYPQS